MNPSVPIPIPRPPPVPDDGDEPLDPTTEELIESIVDLEAQQRLWLRAIVGFLSIRSHDVDPSSCVQTASDMACAAAYDRVARLMRSDEATIDP
jgi:hypothetical protein